MIVSESCSDQFEAGRVTSFAPVGGGGAINFHPAGISNCAAAIGACVIDWVSVVKDARCVPRS